MNDLVFDVRRLADCMRLHADRLSKATAGRIGLPTAFRMTELVDRLVRRPTDRHHSVAHRFVAVPMNST